MSIYANRKYATFDRVLARNGNLDFWEPGFYSRTVTLPDGSVGYLTKAFSVCDHFEMDA